MPQVHRAGQMYVFGSCLPSGHCRSVQQRITTRALDFYRLLLWGSTQPVCCRFRISKSGSIVNMVGASAKPSVVATVHICGAVEPCPVL